MLKGFVCIAAQESQDAGDEKFFSLFSLTFTLALVNTLTIIIALQVHKDVDSLDNKFTFIISYTVT